MSGQNGYAVKWHRSPRERLSFWTVTLSVLAVASAGVLLQRAVLAHPASEFHDAMPGAQRWYAHHWTKVCEAQQTCAMWRLGCEHDVDRNGRAVCDISWGRESQGLSVLRLDCATAWGLAHHGMSGCSVVAPSLPDTELVRLGLAATEKQASPGDGQ